MADEGMESIGVRLLRAREAANLTVDDVVFRTRLPRSVVEGLEAEDFSRFTSPVYAKSFLSQYSRFLNVDADPWLDALQPSNFHEGDPLFPLLDKPELPLIEVAPGRSRDSSGGWLSLLWLVLLSGAVVYGAVRAFEFFEARYADEDRKRPVREDVSENAVAPARTPDPRAPLKQIVVDEAVEREVAPAAREAAPPEAPPRAIIVR